MIDDIAGYQSFFAEGCSGEVAGKAVEIDTELCGLCREAALCEQAGDDTCEHVATAGCGHARVTCGVEAYSSCGCADLRVMSLHDEEDAEVDGEVAGARQAFVGVGAVSHESVELSGVGGEDAVCRHLA